MSVSSNSLLERALLTVSILLINLELLPSISPESWASPQILFLSKLCSVANLPAFWLWSLASNFRAETLVSNDDRWSKVEIRTEWDLRSLLSLSQSLMALPIGKKWNVCCSKVVIRTEMDPCCPLSLSQSLIALPIVEKWSVCLSKDGIWSKLDQLLMALPIVKKENVCWRKVKIQTKMDTCSFLSLSQSLMAPPIDNKQNLY